MTDLEKKLRELDRISRPEELPFRRFNEWQFPLVWFPKHFNKEHFLMESTWKPNFPGLAYVEE